MRIRRKVWAEPELSACSYFIKKPLALRGQWQDSFVKKQPIHLDLGCGKGVFLARAAYKYPELNFIGIDISLDILGVARRNMNETFGQQDPENILFFSHNIERIGEVFSKSDDISRIYVNFCNPWPRAKAHKRRLTHPRQLKSYIQFLQPNGEIWFKTDDADLYLATKRYFKQTGLDILQISEDLHGDQWHDNIDTEHELMFLEQGERIKAIRARWYGGGDETQAFKRDSEQAQNKICAAQQTQPGYQSGADETGHLQNIL